MLKIRENFDFCHQIHCWKTTKKEQISKLLCPPISYRPCHPSDYRSTTWYLDDICPILISLSDPCFNKMSSPTCNKGILFYIFSSEFLPTIFGPYPSKHDCLVTLFISGPLHLCLEIVLGNIASIKRLVTNL